jgi:hypothetical protein
MENEMKDKPGTMNTIVQILEKLRLRKQDNEFKWAPEGFTAGKGKFYQPEDLTIIKTYRFEGDSDPSDSSIIYIIQANDGLIGYSIDAYGVYSTNDDNDFDDFIRKINVEDRDEQAIFE